MTIKSWCVCLLGIMYSFFCKDLIDNGREEVGIEIKGEKLKVTPINKKFND